MDTLTVRTTYTDRDLPRACLLAVKMAILTRRQHTNQPHREPDKTHATLEAARFEDGAMALISHLSLNHLSLVDNGRDALQQILRLYDFTDSPFAQKMIEGITDLKSRQHFAPIVAENGVTFARGTCVDLELDEEQFVGGGVYLFASVIEQFLALYASLNSFTQLTARTQQRREVIREWPPRAGQKVLV